MAVSLFTAIFLLQKAHRKVKFKANKEPSAQHTLAYVSNSATEI